MVSLSSFRSALSHYRRRRYAAQQVRRELGLMTEDELTDLGISRSAIPRLAREAAASTW